MGKNKKILLIKRFKVEKWVKKWGRRLNISRIERDLGIRNNKVQRFIKYGVQLDDQTILNLYEYFKEWTKSFNELDE